MLVFFVSVCEKQHKLSFDIFLRSVIYEILEGIPKTVGGSLSLGESAVAISAGRRAGRFRLPEGSKCE